MASGVIRVRVEWHACVYPRLLQRGYRTDWPLMSEFLMAAAAVPGTSQAPAGHQDGRKLPRATCGAARADRDQKADRPPNISDIRLASTRSPSMVIRPSRSSG